MSARVSHPYSETAAILARRAIVLGSAEEPFPPPLAAGGLIRVVDEAFLRETNQLRGISQQGDRIVVVTLEPVQQCDS